MGARIDLKNQRFGRLVALERYSEVTACGKTQWECQCDCGVIILAITGSLTTGNTQSCGCQRRDSARQNGLKIKHGMTGTPEYKAWRGLRYRCYDPEHENYHNYGGRGITVCDEWKESFEAFYRDMGPRPGLGYSIDRKDVNGNYEPNNCRWATAIEQASNQRKTILYDFKGEKLTLPEISRRTNIPTPTLESRIKRMNLSIDEAVAKGFTPHVYTHNGETKTLREWSDALGISYNKLYSRVVTMKWSIERALSREEN